jgi:hypothetical protein
MEQDLIQLRGDIERDREGRRRGFDEGRMYSARAFPVLQMHIAMRLLLF